MQICLRLPQRRHGREGAGDVDAVQHQRDEAAAATEEAEGGGGRMGRVEGVVPQAAGGRVGGGVRGGDDAGDAARRRSPGATLRP